MQSCFKVEAALHIMHVMAALQYQAIHIRELLSANRSEVQRWLSSLPPFSTTPTQARTARTFTISDLAFFSVVSLLRSRFDMPLPAIASFSGALHSMLNAPTAFNALPWRYFVNQEADGSWRVGIEAGGDVSIALDPVPIWRTVYEFVGVEPNPQSNLPFGLMGLPSSVELPDARRTG